MADLVYILSHGHSGSTLLDLLIGSIPGCFSCGELQFLPWQFQRNGEAEGGVERQDICTCLKTFRNCPVWGAVATDLSAREGYDVLAEPMRYNISLMRDQAYHRQGKGNWRIPHALYRRSIRRCLGGVVHIPLALLVRRPVARNWQLFEAVARISGATHVVDSTKDVVRFDLLRRAHPDHARLVVLCRDVRRVVASYVKRGSAVDRVVRTWTTYYAQLARYLAANPGIPMHFVEYEKLCEDPERERRELAAFLGLSAPDSPLELDTRRNHLVAGNPSRYAGKVTIRCDESWRAVVAEPAVRTQLERVQARAFQTLATLRERSALGRPPAQEATEAARL